MIKIDVNSIFLKVIKCTFNNPRLAIGTEDGRYAEGRVIKLGEKEPDLFLIANKEVKSIDELYSDSFKWGAWVYLKELEKLEILSET